MMQGDLFIQPHGKLGSNPERWIEVAGFPRYEVSTLGRFRNKATGRFLKGTLSHNGYLHIGLIKNGRQITKLAHRLIASSFLKPASPLHQDVNHRNKVRHDNRIDNLEWCTRSFNSIHAKAGDSLPSAVRPPATAQGPLDPHQQHATSRSETLRLRPSPVASETIA